jgi:FkbM family methyltransferase
MQNRHHPVFYEFRRFSGNIPRSCEFDFLGSVTRPEFLGRQSSADLVEVAPDYPPYDEEYFEWIDLLESVILAAPQYTMMELGAGFGRWSVRAAFAAQQQNKRCALVAVEAEPTHFQWLMEHFRENALDPADHSVIHGAVANRSGTASFCVEAPNGGPPEAWYGQAIVDPADDVEGVDTRQYLGSPIQCHRSGLKSVPVLGVTLGELAAGCNNLVDLIDMDIQGNELEVISAEIVTLNDKVKRLHIGTHSPEIEQGLRTLLRRHGWACHADYGMNSTCETPWGIVQFQDGVQSWTNPRLNGDSRHFGASGS